MAGPVSGIDDFLKQNEEKELLRLSTAGSVDDGKSTLIGRLLYDSKGVYEDQLASIRDSPVNRSSGPLDFSLLTDGLRAEREQGITIDVAYRYFSTPRRKFIIADTPGHEQYTRNMATGASTANLAIILIDARNGVLPQSRRHATIATLLGIPHLVVAVNKMDLVEFRQDVFESIRGEFSRFAEQLEARDVRFIPISALLGDNVVDRSVNMPWYDGPGLLEHLETAPISSGRNMEDFRFPVQYVIRPNPDFRGFAGQVASGVAWQGDPVMVLPSGRMSRIKSIATYDGDLIRAFPPLGATICLEDEIDISRGDMLVHSRNLPHVSRRFEANLVWMSSEALEVRRPYLIKHTTQQTKATVAEIRHKVDVNTLEPLPAPELRLNEIGVVTVEAQRPLFFDSYRRNRSTGSFILIDPATNATVGAGMILGPDPRDAARRVQVLEGLEFEASRVTPAERRVRAGHQPATVWLAGEAEIAYEAERKLFDRGCGVHVLADEANPALLAELARVLNSAGLIAICSVASMDSDALDRARDMVGAENFVALDAAEVAPGRAAEEVCRILEARGFVPEWSGPFTGGEGI
ncbi:MAG: sulfate adenylyltransferase subunit CysN [Bryobacteraceae bacterium]